MTGAALGVSRQGGLDKAPGAFRTIREVSEELGVPQHVLRFWESRFGQVRPLKRAGGRRYYRPEDVDLLRHIQRLLYQDGYTIRGVQKLFRDSGVKAMRAATNAEPPSRSATPAPAEPRSSPASPRSVTASQPPPAAAPPMAAEGPLDEAMRARLESLVDALEDILTLLRS